MSDSVGSGSATLVRQSTGYDRQSGKFIEKFWRGTQDQINAAEAELGVTVDFYQKSPEGGGVWSLTARYSAFTEEGTTEVPVREERLRFNQVSKSIYSSPRFASLPREALDEVREAVDDRTTLPSPSLPLQDALYNIAKSGVESFAVFQPSVIVTDTASASFPWDIGFESYGFTYDTVNMIADAALTSGWKANLPADTSALAGFVFGWLKKPPEIVSVAGNKTQLVQEYEYGLWAEAVLPRFGT